MSAIWDVPVVMVAASTARPALASEVSCCVVLVMYHLQFPTSIILHPSLKYTDAGINSNVSISEFGFADFG